MELKMWIYPNSEGGYKTMSHLEIQDVTLEKNTPEELATLHRISKAVSKLIEEGKY